MTPKPDHRLFQRASLAGILLILLYGCFSPHDFVLRGIDYVKFSFVRFLITPLSHPAPAPEPEKASAEPERPPQRSPEEQAEHDRQQEEKFGLSHQQMEQMKKNMKGDFIGGTPSPPPGN